MRGYSFALISLLYCASLFAQQFPRYILKAGKPDPDGNPFDALSSASLCTVASARLCYALPPEPGGDDPMYFYMDPRSLKTTTTTGEELVLFTAHTMGGSGYAYEYALLRYSNQKLINLLPSVRVSNISDRALWNMSSVSPMPIFLTADYLWEDGAHYSEHRYTIRAYCYDNLTSKYVQIASYDTERTYPSAEWPGEVHMLNAERSHIQKLIRKVRTIKR